MIIHSNIVNLLREMFAVNGGGNFRTETISTGGGAGAGRDEFSIRVGAGSGGGSIKGDRMGGSGLKPMSANTSSGKIYVPQDKKLKFKPKAPVPSSASSVRSDVSSASRVPMDSFASISNPKSSLDGSHSGHSDEDEDMGSGDGSDSSSDDGYSAATPNSRGGSSYASGSGSSGSSGSYDSDDSGSESGSDDSGSEDSDDSDESGSDEDSEEGDGKKKETRPRTFEEVQQEKQKLLFELERLQTQGYIPSKRYSMASTYDEMKFERDRLKHMRDQSRSIKWMRSGLISVATGIEWVNKTFNPADIRLEGWAENLSEGIHDYDEVFGELHDKYSSSLDGIPPEIKLVGMVAGSAAMYHITSSFMKKTPLDIQDILKKNPDISRQVQSAAVGEMGSRIDAEFGRGNPVGSLMKGGMQAKMAAGGGPGRGTMAGPANVDDILNELDAGSVGGRMQSFGARGGPPKKKGIVLNL